MTETIATEIEGGVLTITLDRPEKLNAFTLQMRDEIWAALDRADADDEVRAIVVTGRGRGFCSGADLGTGTQTFVAAGAGEDAATYWRQGNGLLSLRILALTKPIIAAINGAAIGFGVTMTLPMDIRIAAQGARFSIPFARRGIVPEAGSTFFLPHVVGLPQALRWSLTGRMFDAAEALAGGLVSEVVAPNELLPAARALAHDIALGAPVAVAMTRRMLWDGVLLGSARAAHEAESDAIAKIGGSPDSAETIAAFLEKRAPRFTARLPQDLPPSVRARLADLGG